MIFLEQNSEIKAIAALRNEFKKQKKADENKA